MYIYIYMYVYVLFEIIVKPRMFGLGIVPKETGSCIFNLVYLKMF